MNLYELSAEAERLDEMLERTLGEEALMSDEDRELHAAMLEGIRTEAEGFADGYARLIRDREGKAEALRAEARRLSEMAKSHEDRAERVRKFLLSCFERLGVKRMHGATFDLAAQANGGKQPVDVFAPIDAIPAYWIRTKQEIDKDAIRDALLSDDPEAAKVASLMPRGFSLRIK